MGCVSRPHKVNLIVGLLSSDAAILSQVKKHLERSYGPTDFESPVMDFTHTEYYKAEMGEGLKRQFLSFKKMLDLSGIYAVKLKTNKLESRFLSGGNRTVNIDPGYLDDSKVVLFSTKDYTHRIYLDKGIHAEVTLFYKDRSYRPWPWTYPDYKTDAYIDILNRIRQNYRTKKAC